LRELEEKKAIAYLQRLLKEGREGSNEIELDGLRALIQ
jgi:hypothetical protein